MMHGKGTIAVDAIAVVWSTVQVDSAAIDLKVLIQDHSRSMQGDWVAVPDAAAGSQKLVSQLKRSCLNSTVSVCEIYKGIGNMKMAPNEH
jgi:hypothetical protein